MGEPERSGRRHFIATGVTAGLENSGDRVVESVSLMTDLLVGEFGYDRVPELGIDPTKDQMEKGVRDFCGRCAPDDLLVIYHTGHGDFVSGHHRLWMGDATGDRLVGTLPTADLVEAALLDTELRSLLLIIDTCFAGRGGAQSLAAGMEAMGRSTDRSLTVLAGAHPLEQIRAGDFAALFKEAVHHQATAGHEPRYLTPQALAEYMKSSPNRKTWQTISCSTLFGGNQPFFANPRYDPRLHGFDVLSQLIMVERQAREEDLRSHFLPRARGVDVPTEVAWRFVGRHAALGELTRWLSDADAGTLRVVTGDPGSGKSAVLARLAVLSEPDWRATVPLDGVPDETVPAAGSIDVAVHARGKTAGQILAALAAAAEVNAPTPGELLRALGRGEGLVAVIDAVDETVDPDHVVSWLLNPLIRGAGAARLRLVLGTRKHLVHRLGQAAERTLDLDAPEYADRRSLRRYASRCLRESTPDSPFRGLPDEVLEPVAAAVAEAAGRSFLVALIVSRTLAAGDRIPDATAPAWRASLPGTAADAMHQDLETRLGADAERARELLRPLAYAHGAGLPWAGTWAPLAAKLSGRLHTDEDIVWLMRNAGAYVIEALEEGSSVYRLYHLSMAEYLRAGRSADDVHAAFVAYLEGRVPEPAPGHRDWTRAPAYTRAHLATHARAAGCFGRFVTDGLFLAMAGPAAVIAALPALDGEAETAAAAVYQRTLHLMRDATVAERLSYLELWGHRLGAGALVEHVRGCPVARPWTTDWAQWPLEHPHRILPGHIGGISSVTVPAGEPSTAITAGWDGVLCVWDLKTAEPLAVRELGRAPLLSVRTVAAPGEPGLVAVLDGALRLHRLDMGTWEPREPIVPVSLVRRVAARLAGSDPVLMCGRLADGRLAAFVGGKRCPAALWDLRSGERLSMLADVDAFWTPVAFGELRDGRPVLLMRRSSGPQAAFQYWDVATGRPLIPVVGRASGTTRFHVADTVYFRDASKRPVAALVFGRQVRCLDLVRNVEIYSAKGLPSAATAPEVRAVTSRVQRVVVGLYPDAEPLAGRLEHPNELVIDPPAGGGRAINGSYADDGQALRIGMTVRGTESELTLSGHTARIAEVAAGAVDDHTVLVTVSGDGYARLWDLNAIARLPSSTRPVRSSPVYRVTVGSLPSGDRVLLSLGAAGIILWDAGPGDVRAELANPDASRSSAVTLLDDGTGRLTAVAFREHGVAEVWDAETSEPVGAIGIHPLGWTMRTAALKRDDGTGALVTTGHGDFSLAWDLPDWSFRKTLRGHAGWTADVDCGRDHRGRPIAVTVGTDGRVCVWNLTAFRRPRRLRSFRRWRSLFVPRSARTLGVRLLTGVFPARMAALLLGDGSATVIDLRTGRTTGRVWVGAAHLAAAALTDGRSVIATATDRGLVTVWEVTVRSICRRPTVRLGPVARIELEVPLNSVELEPDGLLVLGTAHGISCLRITLEPDPA